MKIQADLVKAEERLHQYSEHCLHGQVLQTAHSSRSLADRRGLGEGP